MAAQTPLIAVRNLNVFSGDTVLLKGIGMNVMPGDLVGIAGESGGGKTMLMRTLLNILPEDVEYTADRMELFGTECRGLSDAARRKLTGWNIGFIPQNTVAYLHPLLKIRDQITDAYVCHGRGTKAEGLKHAAELLGKVGFDDPDRILNSYDWELSGGMRQRVNIAMALMNDPDLLIADEPTTALDAQIQRQILDLFLKIHEKTGIAVLMISHDLGMLRRYCDRLLVMYAGRLVETGPDEEIFDHPAHPYTRALTRVIPTIGSGEKRLPEIPGYVPDSGRDTDLCVFRPRCPEADASCDGPVPLRNLGNRHYCRCHKAAAVRGAETMNQTATTNGGTNHE